MFTPEERKVYHCPHTQRAYDPLAVKGALVSAGYNPSHPREKTLLVARAAFNLLPIAPDGSGVLDAVVWDTLCTFTAYLSGKGNRAKPMPPASPCTDSRGESAVTTTGSP